MYKQRPVLRCSVPGCPSNSLDSGVSFHQFPKRPEQKIKWVAWFHELVPNYTPTNNTRVCNKHFTSDSFVANASMMESLGFAKPKMFLNQNACPTIYPNNIPAPQTNQMEIDTPPVIDVEMSSQAKDNDNEGNSCVSMFSDIVTPKTIRSPAKAKAPLSSISYHGKRSLEMTETEKENGPTPRLRPASNVLQPLTMSTFSMKKKSTKCQTLPFVPGFRKHQYSQTALKVFREKGTQTDPLENETPKTLESLATALNDQVDPVYHYEELEEEVSDSDEEEKIDSDDESYAPSEFTEDEVLRTKALPDGTDFVKERKFLVFESFLLQLFFYCITCREPCRNSLKTLGSMVTVTSVCPQNHTYVWNSQPIIQRKPLGNLLIAASILFSGINPTPALRMFESIGMQVFARSTYFRIQKSFLFRAIKSVWESEQALLFDALKDRDLSVGGDARNDSPGHCAKFGSYTFLETSMKKVIHQVVMQSNEVKNSVAMEMESLKKGLAYLTGIENGPGLRIVNFITDRHIQVRAFLRKNYPGIRHLFDVWHLAKSVKKKIIAVAKKPTDRLRLWIRSITNQLYWLAMSSDGNPELMKAKWASVLRHVINKHDGHGEIYEKCPHGDLGERCWLNESSEEYMKLKKIVNTLSKDVAQLSHIEQTSEVEAFHSVIVHFAPKNTQYSKRGMTARLTLAALHYNENSNRIQATTVDTSGERRNRWSIFWPKAKAGEFSVKPIMVASTYEYIDKLLYKVLDFARDTHKEGQNKSNLVFSPPKPSLSSKYSHKLSQEEKGKITEDYFLARRFNK